LSHGIYTFSTLKMLRLRVFLASPGDVGDERALARKKLSELSYDPLLREKVTFEIVAWDQPGASVPMFATMTPQAAIAAGLPKPSECDIVLVIFWSRMGTPLPDEYRKADGTRYLSGTEWEYLNALEAAQASGNPAVLVYRRVEKCLLDQEDPAYEEKRVQFQRVKAFFSAFRSRDGAILRGLNEYASPEEFCQQLEQHVKAIVARRLEERTASKPPPPDAPGPALPLWHDSPFPGLRAFTPHDAPIFFGRGRETDALVHRLSDATTRFVAVMASSGSGKSSLVAAGLLPRLKANAVEGSKDWLLPDVIPVGLHRQWTGLRFTPGELGDNPFLAFAAKLALLLPGESLPPVKVAERLASDPTAIVSYAADTLAKQPEWAELLLFVDQFEELFSVVAEDYRAPFIALIAAATRAPRVRTVATMRADFYHRCLEFPTLAELLRETTFSLAAPGPAARLEMISRPAARAGLAFSGGLQDRILEETDTDPGTLPLLAFALYELYEARTPDGKLTLAAYESFGGVRGAISKCAETAFNGLPKTSQALLQAVFRDLVDVDEHGVATRRRAKLEDVGSSPEALRLVTTFTDARLLVTDRAADGSSTVGVAHEALVREWPRLTNWVRNIAGDLRLRRQAEAAAVEWSASRKNPSYLWPHERLVLVYEALRNVGTKLGNLPEPLKSFIRPEAERLLDELESSSTTPLRRAEIGDRLDRIGDPRPGVGLRSDGLPDIVWCTVPGGTVSLEEAKGKFTVKPFAIAKYLVTLSQYKVFLDDRHGYRDKRWWRGLVQQPKPGVQYRPGGNCPADNVSWCDAVAFCRWLDARLRERGEVAAGHEVRLPTEPEWQQAFTSGNASYRYPWGTRWFDGYANTEEAGVNRTTAVGVFPRGNSKQGVADLLGNVWELCLTRFDAPGDLSLEGGPRAFRGGSPYDDRIFSVTRIRHGRNERNSAGGFRVSVALM
jgi:conflict system STAND superfamily ATPase/sulfatase-modifying factor enzyme 1